MKRGSDIQGKFVVDIFHKLGVLIPINASFEYSSKVSPSVCYQILGFGSCNWVFQIPGHIN